MNENKSIRELVVDKFSWFTRLGILAAVLLMFLPTVNPTKVCSLVNKNMSLFTSAVSYTGLTQDVATNLNYDYSAIVTRPVIYESSFFMIMGFSILSCVGIALMAAGGCMSLGNLKLKRRASLFSLAGSAVLGGGMVGVYMAYKRIISDIEGFQAEWAAQGVVADKMSLINPSLPTGLTVFVAIAEVVFIFSLVSFITLPKAEKDAKCSIETKYSLFLIMLPFIALVFVFSYLPLAGWRYSLFDYKPGTTLSMDNFVGLKWFKTLFQDPMTRKDVLRVIRNTLVMSGLGIGFSWLPMAFAIFLNEIKSKWFKRIVQVFTTIPNFVSWVLVYSLALAIFSTDGFVNNLLTQITGSAHSTAYLQNSAGSWIKMWLWGTWKGIGWSAIIYIAGISGIDPQLYEAATVDGAGRTQKMWHVTVPGLIPTYCVLLLMSVANILSNGMDQYLVFSNPRNEKLLEVLDLYVYNLGLGGGTNTIPLSTVVSMAKSIISVILLFVANGVSKLIRGESIM